MEAKQQNLQVCALIEEHTSRELRTTLIHTHHHACKSACRSQRSTPRAENTWSRNPNGPVILPKTESIYINCVVLGSLPRLSASILYCIYKPGNAAWERRYRKLWERTKELPKGSINVQRGMEMMQQRGYQSQHFFLMNSEPQQGLEYSLTYMPHSIINTLLYFSFYCLACQTHVGCTNACDW